jgi:glutathionyl-hydroquinone reductase
VGEPRDDCAPATGLEDVLSIGFCGPTHDKRSWTFDLDPGGLDPVLKIARLREARFDPVYHGHFKCNRHKLSEMPVLWAYARDLFQTPGFGDTIDFVQIKQHYYVVHADINPTQVVPKGPALSNWLTPHGRDAFGGGPFGDGTPPGPTHEDERVPDGHGGMKHAYRA